jgi:HAE1 family hydrophobic/amphiphilic exporter-1
MVGPNYQRPKVSVSPSFGETGDPRLSAESTNYRDWWKAFNDPVLDRLVARAYRDNLTLQQAGVRVLQARAQLGIAVGEVFPQTQQAIGSVRTKAESLQVLPQSIFDTLQAYLGSSFVNFFNKFNQVFQVYIQADNAYRLQAEDLRHLYVRNQNGEMVPLNALIQVRQVQGTELVTRYNLYPAASIFGSAAPGFSSGQALATMEQLAAETLPEGMSYDWTSTSYQEKKVGYQAYLIYALSIVLVYMVLAALYESWTSPAAVVLVVPVALVGVLLAQLSRGYDNNLYTQVGLVLMIALASKNAILIVEFARDLHHRDGLSIADAAVEATRRRFRPIVMTSFAFILGVVPLMVATGAGAASQQAIGTVVFGGMLASTLLAIPFVPVFYVALEGLSERVRSGRRREPTSHGEPRPPSHPEVAPE